jgi:hypothetical protein
MHLQSDDSRTVCLESPRKFIYRGKDRLDNVVGTRRLACDGPLEALDIPFLAVGTYFLEKI